MDLFKDIPEHAMTPAERKRFMRKIERKKGIRKPTKKQGYAAPPGSGPKGETCRSCEHAVKRGGVAGSYHKCNLMARFWTGGAGTDILLRAPACSRWEKEKKE